MTFRDDHDAALARADALEAEVQRKESELAKAKRRADTNEEEIARLRAENDQLRAASPNARKDVPETPQLATPVAPPKPLRPPVVPMDESTRSKFSIFSAPALLVLLSIVGGLGLAVYILINGKI